jgi:hypothetical protein
MIGKKYLNRNMEFFPKIFQKFFYEYVIFGIDPPFSPDNMSYKGAYGRGEGVILVVPPMGGVCQTHMTPIICPSVMLITFLGYKILT